MRRLKAQAMRRLKAQVMRRPRRPPQSQMHRLRDLIWLTNDQTPDSQRRSPQLTIGYREVGTAKKLMWIPILNIPSTALPTCNIVHIDVHYERPIYLATTMTKLHTFSKPRCNAAESTISRRSAHQPPVSQDCLASQNPIDVPRSGAAIETAMTSKTQLQSKTGGEAR